MLKKPAHHFLHFTRKEKNGTIFIFSVILLIVLILFIYTLIFPGKETSISEFKDELVLLNHDTAGIAKKYDEPTHHKSYFNNSSEQGTKTFTPTAVELSLFYFDPNTLPEAGWKKMGLKEKTIATIQKYLSKGGRFKEPGDIRKIWGLHEDEINQMMPYIRIEKNSTPIPRFTVAEKAAYIPKTIAPVDINEADSSAFESLPGIGPGFAKRILKFRDKLGGFYRIEQIAETYGLPDSTFQKIRDKLLFSSGNIRKININTAGVDQLKEHPYIRYQLANAILQYRTQHGNFTAVEDIKKIMMVTDSVFVKLSPYLTVQ